MQSLTRCACINWHVCISEYSSDSWLVAELQRVKSERLIADLHRFKVLYTTPSLTVTCVWYAHLRDCCKIVWIWACFVSISELGHKKTKRTQTHHYAIFSEQIICSVSTQVELSTQLIFEPLFYQFGQTKINQTVEVKQQHK